MELFKRIRIQVPSPEKRKALNPFVVTLGDECVFPLLIYGLIALKGEIRVSTLAWLFDKWKEKIQSRLKKGGIKDRR